MTEDQLTEWAIELKKALENPKLCLRKRAIIEKQLLDVCLQLTSLNKKRLTATLHSSVSQHIDDNSIKDHND